MAILATMEWSNVFSMHGAKINNSCRLRKISAYSILVRMSVRHFVNDYRFFSFSV